MSEVKRNAEAIDAYDPTNPGVQAFIAVNKMLEHFRGGPCVVCGLSNGHAEWCGIAVLEQQRFYLLLGEGKSPCLACHALGEMRDRIIEAVSSVVELGIISSVNDCIKGISECGMNELSLCSQMKLRDGQRPMTAYEVEEIGHGAASAIVGLMREEALAEANRNHDKPKPQRALALLEMLLQHPDRFN